MLHSSRRQTYLICLFLILVVIFMTTFRMGVVRGESMSPTFANGQIVLVRRLATLKTGLHRGDVVLVNNDHDVIIKRIFRLPGEEVDHSFPDVLGSAEHRDMTDYYEQKPVKTPSGTETHYYVPDGYLVVIGDNTLNSEDSRVFGPVSIKDVLGVVVRSPPAPYSNEKPGGGKDGNQNGTFGPPNGPVGDFEFGNRPGHRRFVEPHGGSLPDPRPQ